MKKFILFGLCVLGCSGAMAELKPTAFPKTVDDVPFTERMENKRMGYEPFKDLNAYSGPNLTTEKKGTNSGGRATGGNDSPRKPIVGGNENSQYYIVQCRTTFPHVQKYMESNRNIPFPLGAILSQDEHLECSDEYHASINKCFSPCDSGVTEVGKINQELNGVIDSFCAGNGISSEKNAVLMFSNPETGRDARIYTKAEADAVLAKINGYYKECGTNGRRWYWYLFVFESQDGGQNFITYDYRTIGK